VNILRLLTIADLFTIGNLCSGLLAIFLATQERYGLSAALIAVAVVFDTLDGKIAGWLHQQHDFGKQLDSLADLVSFAVAPAYLYFSLSPQNWFIIASLLFFAACGMLRLARYNISQSKAFEGIPITVNGVVFPTFYLLSLFAASSLNYWPIIFVLMGILMVSSIRVNRLL
jgi:CDP-diacylglycerol--serine O-phosphatidyltransferase